jgi:hypothetical protein
MNGWPGLSWAPDISDIPAEIGCLIEPIGDTLDGIARLGHSEEAMSRYSWLIALFVLLALAGCAKGILGQAGAPYPPHQPANHGSIPEHGGGDGGGGGGSM